MLRWIFTSGLRPQEGSAQLSNWFAWAQYRRLEPFVKLNRIIRMHMDGIFAIFENPGLTHGPSERIAR